MSVSASMLIRKVQKKEPLSSSEIFQLIEGFGKGEIPDYQMSAFLMAVYYQGLSEEEKESLTLALMKSGITMEWPTNAVYVDKHSTGGVGDKTSIIIAPLLASLGYKVPMMAGRGLGHTGGTLDKLESLAGFNCSLSLKDFKRLTPQVGAAMIGQTNDFCPADKKLYALRDVTCTVSSLPLITASIVSKKIAEGSRALVYDVKTGTGAFIKKFEESKALAESLVKTTSKLGAKAVALITDMSQPLGRYVGNQTEMFECFEILKNAQEHEELYKDTIELSLHLTARLISTVETEKDFNEIYAMSKTKLYSGDVYHKAIEIFKAQGWNGVEEKLHDKFLDLKALQEGYISQMDCESIGWAGVELGGGRKVLSDTIDPKVGFYFFKKHGDYVEKNESLVRIYYNSEEKLKAALPMLEKAYSFSSEKPESLKLVQEVVYGN